MLVSVLVETSNEWVEWMPRMLWFADVLQPQDIFWQRVHSAWATLFIESTSPGKRTGWQAGESFLLFLFFYFFFHCWHPIRPSFSCNLYCHSWLFLTLFVGAYSFNPCQSLVSVCQVQLNRLLSLSPFTPSFTLPLLHSPRTLLACLFFSSLATV